MRVSEGARVEREEGELLLGCLCSPTHDGQLPLRVSEGKRERESGAERESDDEK